jgi:predicted nucleic acid-binding protein
MRSGRILRVDDVVKPHRGLHVIENDPDDDGVLEGAVEGDADFINTGDRQLLKLGNCGASKTLTAREFLDLTLPHLIG